MVLSNTFDRLINICFGQKATDVHFSVGQNPICRINGDLVRLQRLGFLSDADVSEFIRITVPEDKKNELLEKKGIYYNLVMAQRKMSNMATQEN